MTWNVNPETGAPFEGRQTQPPQMDWNDPGARLRLLMEIGAEEYTRRFMAYREASTITTINGYAIRPVFSSFGQLFEVAGTGRAFYTQAEAEERARSLPTKGGAL